VTTAHKYIETFDSAEPKGKVYQREVPTIVISVEVSGISNNEEAEYVLMVNGRTVKRMTHFQAKRLGMFLNYE
jgi:hypothetical protein